MVDIVLVEPDRVLAKTYARALQAAGYKVVSCAGAQTGIHSVDKQSPKLVIVELQLAGHNGVEFLYELRSHSDWQNIKVIVLSTVPPEEAGLTPQIQNKLGISRYCYKPQTTLEQLIETVAQALPRR
jgi:DNA-binding response OmpR family regulator